jgi:hypothetical protein
MEGETGVYGGIIPKDGMYFDDFVSLAFLEGKNLLCLFDSSGAD